jgi:hypothetical protein
MEEFFEAAERSGTRNARSVILYLDFMLAERSLSKDGKTKDSASTSMPATPAPDDPDPDGDSPF